ncbi:MAG: OprO/OprP family phosphate-selective porin [Candidatus Scalindua sp.]|nr:OprO/OprP family phosphate-selective porin [Candidatus Scalindua sp.]
MRRYFIPFLLLVSFIVIQPIPGLSAVETGQDDLRLQLKRMEEVIKSQQAMLEALKVTVESQKNAAQSSSAAQDKVIGERIKAYLHREQAEGNLAQLLRPPVEVGYKEGFYFQTSDHRFSMRMTGRLQMRYGYEDRDAADDDSSYMLRRARLKWDGYAYGHFKYKIELALRSTGTKSTDSADGDMAKAVELFDWWAEYGKYSYANIRFGQWKVPFNRQRVVSSSVLQLIDRSLAQDVFTMDRQIGAQISGKVHNRQLEYYLGMFNGNGRNESSNGDTEHMYIARLSWSNPGGYGKGIEEQEADVAWSEKPLYHISAAISFDSASDLRLTLKDGSSYSAKEVDWTNIVGEYGLKYKGFSTNAEFYWSKAHNIGDEEIANRGFFVQGGYFVIPHLFEVAGRYSYVDYDDQLKDDSLKEVALGLNWYFEGSHNNKLQFNYINVNEGLPGADVNDKFYRLQYQIAF